MSCLEKSGPDCEGMGDSNGVLWAYIPAIFTLKAGSASFFILLTFFLFLALALDVWCFITNGPPHAWVNMEYKLRKCEDMYSSLNEENLISMSIYWKEV